MTPIGSTSSNIRRAIEFMVLSSSAALATDGRSRSVGLLRPANLIARRRSAIHPEVAGKRSALPAFGSTAQSMVHQ